MHFSSTCPINHSRCLRVVCGSVFVCVFKCVPHHHQKSVLFPPPELVGAFLRSIEVTMARASFASLARTPSLSVAVSVWPFDNFLHASAHSFLSVMITTTSTSPFLSFFLTVVLASGTDAARDCASRLSLANTSSP